MENNIIHIGKKDTSSKIIKRYFYTYGERDGTHGPEPLSKVNAQDTSFSNGWISFTKGRNTKRKNGQNGGQLYIFVDGTIISKGERNSAEVYLTNYLEEYNNGLNTNTCRLLLSAFNEDNNGFKTIPLEKNTKQWIKLRKYC